MRLGSLAARHRESGPAVVSGLLLSSLAVATSVALALVLGNASLALWNDYGTINAGNVVSATMQLTVNSGPTTALSGTSWSTLLPGDVVSQEVTLQNTGDVPTIVSAVTTGSFGPLLVHTKKGACSTTISGTSSTVSPTAVGSFAAGESSVACIQVSLPLSTANSQQGSNETFTVTYTGTTGS